MVGAGQRFGAALAVLALVGTACGRDVEACSDDCIAVPSGDITLAAELDLPPGEGPHPVMVMVHRSGEVTRHGFAGVVPHYLSIGVGTLRYDKRGVDQSTGKYRDVNARNSTEVFDLLASDVIALVDFLKTQPGIDANRIGLIGVSQAGWVMPLAASRSEDIAFFISLSGAASTVGVSDFYDVIAGGDLTETQIASEIGRFDGVQGFDPVPYLEALTIPALWLYGEQDKSNPTVTDIAILGRIKAELGKDFTIHLFPDADHDFVDSRTGGPVNAQSVLDQWLSERIMNLG